MVEIGEPALLPGVVLVAVAAALAVRVRRSSSGGAYDVGAAWLRAGAAFAAAWAIAALAGVFGTLRATPLILVGQASQPVWWAWTVGCVMLIAAGYWVVWPMGTLRHGRSVVYPDTVLFGVVWGLSEGLLFASVWLTAVRVFGRTGMGALWTVVVTFVVLSGFIAVWHDRYWDVHVAPEHNIPEWNPRKVAFVHTPNLVLTTIYVTLFGNVAVWVGLQALALSGAALFMAFPSPRHPDPQPTS